MIRVRRVRLSLVIAALAILLVVPMVGARTLSSPSIHSADGGWLGASLRWAEGFAGFLAPVHHRHSGSQVPPNQKAAAGGGCLVPDGLPKPPRCF